MSKSVITQRTMTTGNLPKPKPSGASGGQTNTGGNNGTQQGGQPQKKE